MLEDSLRRARDLYYRFPDPLKRVVGGAYAALPLRLRFGRSFGEFQRLLDDSASWSTQDMLDYQFEQTKRTLLQAYEHVPFYGERFAEYGVSPALFTSLDDISRFPLLTKRDIQQNFAGLIAGNVSRSRHLETRTGGSTAAPLQLVQEKGVTRSKERAFITDGWSRAGYYQGARCVQLKGRSVGCPEKGIFWEYEPIQRYLEMDSNYLSEEHLPKYLEAITDFAPEFITGFVSSLYLLARYVSERGGMTFPSVRAIYLASENVYPEQRELLERVFGCRIFSHYGHSEMVLLGMECECSHDLHFYPQYGLLEMLDSEGAAVRLAGESGELVGTSFHNDVMPLIRYRTQDYGTLGRSACDCGRAWPTLASVEGRLQEYIVTSDDRLVSICTMGAAHFAVSEWVYETQYYQEVPGVIQFRVVPRSGYDAASRGRIRDILQEKLGKGVEVHVVEVEKIERSASGKHVMIEQKLTTVMTGNKRTKVSDS